MMRLLAAAAILFAAAPSLAQSPIPNDPFRDVPAPVVRPRPVEPAPQPVQRPAPAQQQPARSGYPVPVGQSFRDCAECPEMVVIPAGRFTMGSPTAEPWRSPSEGPQREVVAPRPLAVGKFEVTFAEWDACVAASGCSHRPDAVGWDAAGRGRSRQPVMNVSWDDAQQYVRWLSGRTGRRYRLLTEAEWEYAARAGTSTAYAFGPTISPSQANYVGGGPGRTQPAGSYPANAWGLHDMHGNVWEWVQDCYVEGYGRAPSDAGQTVERGGCSARVLRGGSWAASPQSLRSANRGRDSSTGRGNDLGFRVARTPD
jgi:formylglycine-generating enzyme required for sulfatase activity